MIKVYGVALSPFVRKVHAILRLKNLPFESEDVFPGMVDEQFLTVSPLGKIPALTDGDLALCDSTVIAEYLEEKYPEVSLLPQSPEDRAQARWIEEYADTKILELVGGGIFYEKMVKPVLMKQETDEERVEKTINELLPPALAYVESIAPQQGFFFQEISIADISLVTHFINGEYAGYEVSANQYPNLAQLIASVKSHPVIAQILEDEKPMITALLGS